jgi:hypothetical protein
MSFLGMVQNGVTVPSSFRHASSRNDGVAHQTVTPWSTQLNDAALSVTMDMRHGSLRPVDGCAGLTFAWCRQIESSFPHASGGNPEEKLDYRRSLSPYASGGEHAGMTDGGAQTLLVWSEHEKVWLDNYFQPRA